MSNNYQVVVCGAGTSGIAAAIASARNGARTLLLERTISIGGSISRAFVYPMMTFHATKEKQIVAGIAQELIDLAIRLGLCPGHLPDMTGSGATITPIEAADFAECAKQLVNGAGVDVLLNAEIVDVIKCGNKLTSIIINSSKGKEEITAEIFIDTTGNGDVACIAGADYTYGRAVDSKAQPLTRMFIMSGVDHAQVRDYIKANPDQFVLAEDAKNSLDSYSWLAVSGFFDLIAKAQQVESKLLFRDRVLYFQMRDNRAAVNMTRLLNIDGTNKDQMSDADALSRAQIEECVYVLQKYIPGFSASRLQTIAPEIGIRETRHIAGDYTLNQDDVFSGEKFDDGVACGAFPIDIHSPDGAELGFIKMMPGTYYNIPYRCLLAQGLDALLLAGRCISATHEASASARVSPTSMALGEAAGTAAALSVMAGVNPRDLSIERLRHQLLSQGAIIS